MNIIKEKYKGVVNIIANSFAKKYYKDCFDEIEYSEDIDYDLIDYKGIPHMIEICDEYYSIEDMLFTLDLDINCKDLSKRYQTKLEHNMEDKSYMNLYNYYLNFLKKEEN